MSNTVTPNRPDFAVIACTVEIESPIDYAWSRIGSYADAGRFLDVTSTLTSGDGHLGSIRLIAGSVVEVMVGCSDYSYTYAQVRGPMSAYAYHGCVSLSFSKEGQCTLNYTLVYDQGPMSAAERAEQYDRISFRFKGASEAMKQFAEASR